MKTSYRLHLLLLLAFVFASFGTLSASATGRREIAGYVQAYLPFDISPVPHPLPAIVRVYSKQMGFFREVHTDEYGYYSVSGLMPGTYTVAVNVPVYSGHIPPATQSVTLRKKGDGTVDFLLHYRNY